MPGWLVLAVVVFIIGCIWKLIGYLVPEETERDAKVVKWIGRGIFALAALFILVSSYNPVGTKEEGIVTSFGKTTGHLANGPHFIWPWEKVHQMDAAIQTDSFVGKDCITVRIANQVVACAPISFQWRIRPEKADELYKDFRSFDHVRDALVTRNLVQAANRALSAYNPLDHIVNGEGKGSPANGSDNGTLKSLSARITAIMRSEIGQTAPADQNRVVVLSSILQPLHFDDATQGRINQLQQQVALTRIARQQFQTNTAQAKANAALAQSVNSSPNVLVSRCLDTLEAMVKASQSVPAGFSCWPGGGVAAVIAGPK